MSKFSRAVKKHGGYKAVAALLECSYEYVRAISTGVKSPSLAMAFKIQESLGVPVSHWKNGPASDGDTDADVKAS